MDARAAVLLCLALGACHARGPGSLADADADAPTDASVVDADAPAADGRRLVDGRCEAEGAYSSGADGVCVCPPRAPSDCGSVCADFQTDDANCGACGHACGPTATCQAGTCGSPVTTVVAAAAGCGQIDVALAAGALYWADRDHGTISRMMLPDGAPTTFVTAEAKPDLLTVAGSKLFWIDVVSSTPVDGSVPLQMRTTAKVRALMLPDGQPVDLATEVNSTGGILGLAVSADGSRVYYSAGTAVRVVPSGGGSAVDVVSAMNGVPAALALAGSVLVYATTDKANIELATVAEGATASCAPPESASSSCRELVDGQGGLFSRTVLLSGGRVIWATGDALLTILVSESTYKSITYFASTVTALAAVGDEVFVGIAGERGPGPGEILAVAAAPDAVPTRLARDQAAVSIAADATAVYWATSDCRINRVPR